MQFEHGTCLSHLTFLRLHVTQDRAVRAWGAECEAFLASGLGMVCGWLGPIADSEPAAAPVDDVGGAAAADCGCAYIILGFVVATSASR